MSAAAGNPRKDDDDHVRFNEGLEKSRSGRYTETDRIILDGFLFRHDRCRPAGIQKHLLNTELTKWLTER